MAPTISPPGAPGEGLSDAQVGLPWLWKLRWGAAAGQLGLVLAGEWVLGGLRHFGILLALVACTALSNLAFTRARFRAGGRLLPAVLVLDVGLLTAMLAVSGGASNPFSVFFLVHVALASVLLRPAYAWAMVVLTVAAFGALFALPGGNHAMHVHGSSFSGHLWGMWVAFALAATFVAYFIGRVTTALKERDRRLVDLGAGPPCAADFDVHISLTWINGFFMRLNRIVMTAGRNSRVCCRPTITSICAPACIGGNF